MSRMARERWVKANQDPFGDLRQRLRGEIHAERAIRELYSTDASLYYLLPKRVILPRNPSDIHEILSFSKKNNVPLTPRGSGTSTAGQAIGEGMVLDFSRHLNQIQKLNPNEKWVEVEPGIVYAELNNKLKPFGLFFPVNPSSGGFCTLGGMLANNASGPYSLKYGSTKHHVLGLKVFLSDGSLIDTRNPPEDLKQKIAHILFSNQNLINQYTPNVSVNSSGYNLMDCFNEGEIDLTQIFLGSEGTLGIIVSATLGLTEIPQVIKGAILEFSSLESCVSTIPPLRELRPTALEFMDDELISAICQSHSQWKSLFSLRSRAALFLEFDSNSPLSIGERLDVAKKKL